MKHSTGKPTKAEQARMDAMIELGCIACILEGVGSSVSPEIHHFLSGNKRRGHMFSAPLCCWHHRAEPFYGYSMAECLETFGPSFHKHTRAFRIRYGRDDDLIETVNTHLANGYWRE